MDSSNIDSYEIGAIEFGILSADEIKSMATCKVDKTGLLGPGTVYDTAMGYMAGATEGCVTCKQKRECWGHFGYIELNEPVLHPMLYKMIVSFLRCFCKSCYRLLDLPGQTKLAGLAGLKGQRKFVKILERLEKSDICPHCGAAQPKIVYKSKDGTISMEHKKKRNDGVKPSIVASVDQIKEIFDSILDEDVILLGLNPQKIHPRNLILTVLPVIPPCSRPYVITDGNICDDDLTYQLVEIVKLNNQLISIEENPDTKKKNTENKRQQIVNSLKFRISTMMNNSKGQAKHPTDSRPLKCIKSRLAGKGGRVRLNLMG